MKPIELVQAARSVVVKVGTAVLSGAHHALDEERVRRLAEDLAGLRHGGRRVILVTSGAIGAGMGILGWERRPAELARSQAAAAVGQGRLIQLYAEAFRTHGIRVGQILLTREDLRDRRRYLNARQTMETLLGQGVLPIVNENDTVSTEEIRFGDNDELSALVANLMNAGILVILSDVEGFERRAQDGSRELLPLVERVTPEMVAYAGGASRPTSTGGMISKLHAARMATSSGIAALLANGTRPGILRSLFEEGHLSGTLFLPRMKGRVADRKRWLAFTTRPKGIVRVDDGAQRALTQQGRSLLASGVSRVAGRFRRGDLVSVRGAQDQEIARGLVRYSDSELQRIRGMKSEAITQLLGRKAEEVIHRDSMVILE